MEPSTGSSGTHGALTGEKMGISGSSGALIIWEYKPTAHGECLSIPGHPIPEMSPSPSNNINNTKSIIQIAKVVSGKLHNKSKKCQWSNRQFLINIWILMIFHMRGTGEMCQESIICHFPETNTFLSTVEAAGRLLPRAH